MTEKKTPEVHNVSVVPAKDGRAGLYQGVCTCGFESKPDFQSLADRLAALHLVAVETQNQR